MPIHKRILPGLSSSMLLAIQIPPCLSACLHTLKNKMCRSEVQIVNLQQCPGWVCTKRCITLWDEILQLNHKKLRQLLTRKDLATVLDMITWFKTKKEHSSFAQQNISRFLLILVSGPQNADTSLLRQPPNTHRGQETGIAWVALTWSGAPDKP